MRLKSGLAAILALGTLAAAAPASAQSDYPNREIRWIIPWNPGGSNDIMARFLQPLLAEQGVERSVHC